VPLLWGNGDPGASDQPDSDNFYKNCGDWRVRKLGLVTLRLSGTN
jgi:hypothetical protein